MRYLRTKLRNFRYKSRCRLLVFDLIPPLQHTHLKQHLLLNLRSFINSFYTRPLPLVVSSQPVTMLFIKAIALFAVVGLAMPNEDANEHSISLPELDEDAADFNVTDIESGSFVDIEARDKSECYSSGNHMPEHAYVAEAISYGCKRLAGRYEQQQRRTSCRTTGFAHMDMEVKNVGQGAHWTGVGACTDYFNRIYNRCDRGGWIGTANFFYR